MLIKTVRFGEIEVSQEQIIHFPWGLPGFLDQRRFVPIEYKEKAPICFLQSVDAPDLTFIIADPFYFLNGKYAVDIPEGDLAALQITSQKEAVIYVILTVRDEGKKVSANLAAPLVVNVEKRLARQVILVNSNYDSRFLLSAQVFKKSAYSSSRGK